MESDKKIKVCKNMMGSFMPFAQKRMGFDKTPNVRFLSNPTNASQALGKTAYYDPNNQSVSLYIDNRHPKDIMRSLSHELVHHTQNLRGDLQDTSGLGEQGYAQTNEHLREMEREAYETGNLCFRDWEDGYKQEQGNILMENKRTEELQQQLDLYSDMFKDREGFRPRWIYDSPDFDTVEKVDAAIEALGPLSDNDGDDWYEYQDEDDLDTMVDINYDMGFDEKEQEWAKWWNKTQGRRRAGETEPDPGPVPGGSTSSRFPGGDASELAYRKGAGAGHRSAKVSRGAGSRRRDKEEIAAQLQETIAKNLLNNQKLLKEALSDKQKFAQAVKGELENKMKKNKLNEEFVRKVVRRYLAEMGPRGVLPDETAYGSEEVERIYDQGPGSMSKEKETCFACTMGDYCPEHDPANMEDDCPDCAMGNCPVHDTLYEGEEETRDPDLEGARRQMCDGMDPTDPQYHALCEKKNLEEREDKKGEYDDGDGKKERCDYVPCENKKETNESKIYIPENRSMYDLHDQRLFENLKKWAVKK